MSTAPTVKPANPQQAAARRKELWLAYETKVFAELRRGRVPVKLVGPLGDRSEILLGLKKPGESNDAARLRLVLDFVSKHAAVSSSAAIDATV